MGGTAQPNRRWLKPWQHEPCVVVAHQSNALLCYRVAWNLYRIGVVVAEKASVTGDTVAQHTFTTHAASR